MHGALAAVSPLIFKVTAVSNAGSGGGDRRRVCRYPVVLPDASLGWWLEHEFTSIPARLINLSLHGCLIEVDSRPTLCEHQSVWVHAHSLAVAEWNEGQVIAIKKSWTSKCRIRILFLAPMQYEPFKKLIYGREHFDDSTQPDSPEHERDHFWR